MGEEGQNLTAPSGYISPQQLEQNVRQVQRSLAENCYKDAPPAKLIAVTKTVDAPVVEMLKPLHIVDIGENRAQVARLKMRQLSPGFHLHWIGRLQTNKVKDIIEDVCLLHTLDRMALAQEVHRRASMAGRVLPVLVQVNIAREPQKAGLEVAEVRPFLRLVHSLPGLRVKGLMGMMPLHAQDAQLTEWFRGMRMLFDQLRQEALPGIDMEELSMGMSNDYILAAREGATMVRIGTALYRA